MEKWEQVPEAQFSKLLEGINDVHNRPFFNEDSVLEEQPISFYRDYKLLKATASGGLHPISMQFFYNDKEVIKLNGDRSAFEEMAKKADVNITKYNVVAYAKFFLGSLMTDGGSFQIVQNMDDVEFTGEPTEELLKELPDLIKTAKVKETDDGFILDVSMLYFDCLYDATISVSKKGIVDIKEEKAIRTDVPTREIYLL